MKYLQIYFQKNRMLSVQRLTLYFSSLQLQNSLSFLCMCVSEKRHTIICFESFIDIDFDNLIRIWIFTSPQTLKTDIMYLDLTSPVTRTIVHKRGPSKRP